MNEHKCPKCDNELIWVGNVMDGHMECRACKEEPITILIIDDTITSATKKFEDREFDDPLNYFVEHAQHSQRRTGRTHKAVLELLDQMWQYNMPGVYLVPTAQMAGYIMDMVMRIMRDKGWEVKEDRVQNRVVARDPNGGQSIVLYVHSAHNNPRGFSRSIKLSIDHSCYEMRGLGDRVREWEVYHGRS